MTGLRERVVLSPDDGSLGPLLRLADDRLEPGAGYGRHAHRAVDVVAVVLAGSVRHAWADGAVVVGAGDVAVLRAGTGLEHDEVAGDNGARVLQCYLRAAEPDAQAAHEVHRGLDGWVDLRRADARLWVAPAGAGRPVDVPAGLLVVAGNDVTVEQRAGGTVRLDAPAPLLVWQFDAGRPSWAEV